MSFVKNQMSKFGTSLGKAAVVGFGALDIYTGYLEQKDNLGGGVGIVQGIGTAALYGSLGLGAGLLVGFGIEAAKAGIEMSQESFKNKRRRNFARPVSDPYNNLYTMRQRSAQVLGRGRSSLGQEARMFHL